MIIPGIKDLRIHDWISAEHARLVELPFLDFMKEMHINYLHQDWEDQIRNQILTSTLTSSQTSFWNWSQKLLKLNCLLRGTASVFDDAALRNHLEAHLDEELHARLKHNKARKDKVLKTWIASVRLIDEARAVETKRHRELIEETLDHQAKRQNTKTDALRGPARRGNTSQPNANTTGSSSASNFVKLPPLTDTERTLLNEHEGCMKCRRFYTDHRSQSCPNGFPLGKGYKTLTLSDALAAKKGKAVAKSARPSKPVAATSATIEDVDTDKEISATAAILPNSPAEYTSDSDEDWDVSCGEVSLLPLHGKHLVWNCQIHSQTMNDFPVKTCALIDNGAHLVLIRPDLVDRLGLKKFKLHAPELIDVAFSKENKKTKLYYYVKLSLSSLDSTWTSCVIKAVVTTGLCLPIILGLPWLEKNNIVTDHAAWTCIDKIKLYDLLNSPHISPPLPRKP
jgi:hypothetical protein